MHWGGWKSKSISVLWTDCLGSIDSACIFEKKECKQRLSWASSGCIKENKQNINKVQTCCTTSQLWSLHRRAQRHSCTVSLQPGEGSAAQNSPKALCTAHIHRATAHSFFLKTLGCWGTAAAPTALWRADKPCALRKIAVPSPFQAMSCKLHFTCFISYDKCRVVKHLLGKLGRGEVVAL